MKLYYEDMLLGEILTNHSMSVDEAVKFLDLDLDKLASEHGWDDWEWESLHLQVDM